MKQKLFSVISGILLLGSIALPASALADEHQGSEGNEPEHSISQAHEGIEGVELFAAGAGVVIAVGLAYVIGRRSGKKQ